MENMSRHLLAKNRTVNSMTQGKVSLGYYAMTNKYGACASFCQLFCVFFPFPSLTGLNISYSQFVIISLSLSLSLSYFSYLSYLSYFSHYLSDFFSLSLSQYIYHSPNLYLSKAGFWDMFLSMPLYSMALALCFLY